MERQQGKLNIWIRVVSALVIFSISLPRGVAIPTYHTEHFSASSTWQQDTRKFGPQHALDSQSMDAWKSAPSNESNPLAYYEIYFQRPVTSVREIRLQFQGGFVGMDCTVYKKKLQSNHSANKSCNGCDWEELEEIFVDPVESNDIQIFQAEVDTVSSDDFDPCTALRIEFRKSSDFYGRIVIYSLEVWGLESLND